MDKGPKPLEFPELAEMANVSLMASWDRDQPIRRYVAATRQLLRESNVYRSEGDYDKAFVYSIKIHTLTSTLLPKEHPQWSKLPVVEKKAIMKEADQITYQINDLKGLIQDRNDAWARGVPVRVPTPSATPRPASPTAPRRQPSPAPSASSSRSTSSRATSITTAPGSNVALTLTNTVQPGQMSMSSNVPSSTPLPTLTPKYPTKENRATKWKRKLGIVKELPVGAGYLAEPGAGVDEAPGQDDEREWTMLPGPNSRHANGPGFQSPSTNSQGSHSAFGYSAPKARETSMPLPGEDDEDEAEAEGIVFQAGASTQQSWAMPVNSSPAHRPPSLGSGSPLPPPQYGAPPLPNGPQYQQHQSVYSPSWSGNQTMPPMPQPAQYLPQNLYAPPPPPPPQQAMPWPSSAYPSAPPSQPPLQQPNPGSGLARSPSRLTTSHQQQQGYSPSHFAVASMPPRMPLPTVHGMPVASWNPPSAPVASNLVGNQASGRHPGSIHSLHPLLPPIIPPPPRVPPYPSSASAPVTPVNPNPHVNAPRTSSLNRPSSNTSLAASPSLVPSAPPAMPRPLTRTTSMSMAGIPVGLLRPRNTPSRKQSGNSSFQVDGLTGLKVASVIEEEPDEDELTKTEGGQPLRNVRLPMELISSFIKSAAANTSKGVETCGLLMGSLSHDTFTISTLLIPKQVGTTDTCTTTHEEEQFEFQDKRDLMTLGWIHTHPTQSCFMSSLDLHTHSSYQLMLAEAIAIVCAPRHEPSFGIFRLTDPPGLEIIVKCTAPGAFHPHPDLPIYTDTDHGHVQLRNRLPFESVDLRAK